MGRPIAEDELTNIAESIARHPRHTIVTFVVVMIPCVGAILYALRN